MDIFNIHAVTIRPRVTTIGKAGGASFDYSGNNRSDTCRIVVKTTDLAVKYGRYSFNWSHILYWDRDPALKENYEIVYQGRTFTVRGIYNAQELSRFWLTFCTEGD